MLRLDLELDQNIHPYNLRIVPQDKQDNDILNAFSRRYCSVVNPALIFTEDVKGGDYDSYTDEEYEKILALYRKLSDLFRENGCAAGKPQPNGNIFELFIRLLHYYLASEQEQTKASEESSCGKASHEESSHEESSRGESSCSESSRVPEEILLGGLLVDVKISQMIRGSLTDEDFAEPDNALLFRSIQESIISEDELPDIQTIAENYGRKTGCGKAEAIDVLRNLIAITPATAGISYYDGLIKNRMLKNKKQKKKKPKT